MAENVFEIDDAHMDSLRNRDQERLLENASPVPIRSCFARGQVYCYIIEPH